MSKEEGGGSGSWDNDFHICGMEAEETSLETTF